MLWGQTSAAQRSTPQGPPDQSVLSAIPYQLSLPFRSPRNLAALSIAAAAIAGIAWYALRQTGPSAAEVEPSRRDLLAATGRITDPSITAASVQPERSSP